MLAHWYGLLLLSDTPLPPYITGKVGKKRPQIHMSGFDVTGPSYTPKPVYRSDDEECLLLIRM